ncbi:MAG: cobalamin-independent methionine synthase II family protein [Acidimicrobiales bacterium]
MQCATPRAETVGSLLQPTELLAARARHAADEISADELRTVEDRAVLAAVALQEQAGMDIVTDGEMRRVRWADTARRLGGLASVPGIRSYPQHPRMAHADSEQSARGAFPVVVERIEIRDDPLLGSEFAYLHEHATTRAKYTLPAPSYHRRYWSDEVSTGAYPTCEDFLSDIRDWLHDVAVRLVAQGCTYLQLDAPSYGSLCDPDTRAFHVAAGHDIDHTVRFDAALDCSVFEGLDVTRALHVCRGNLPGGAWHSSGGYGAIADALFRDLRADVVLLEYDSERAGDFSPLRLLPADTVAVLGLVTTKSASLEERGAVEARVAEAAQVRGLDTLALSTQCGFASAENAPMTADEQAAKLRLVADVAHSIWA